jgi:hypothetical protein
MTDMEQAPADTTEHPTGAMQIVTDEQVTADEDERSEPTDEDKATADRITASGAHDAYGKPVGFVS